MDSMDDAIVEQLLGFVEQTADCVGVSDPWGRLMYLNPAARKRLGVDDVEGLTIADLFPGESFAFYYEVVRPQLLHRGEWSGEILVKAGEGPAVPMYVSTTARLGPGGETNGGVVYARELPSGAATPRKSSAHGGTVEEQLREVLAADPEGDGRCGVIVIAVVDVTDQGESPEASRATTLHALMSRLRRLARTTDIVAQVGDDELCLIVRAMSDEGAVLRHARLVMDELRDRPITTPAGDIRADITLGTALSTPDDDPASLIARARAMMNRGSSAKGPAPSQQNAPEVGREISIAELTRAMSHGDVKVFVQPVADLRSGELIGYRGLARWQHKRLGMLKAGAFIPLAADTPLANVIDLYVARETAAVIALKQRSAPIQLFTPVSMRLIEDVRTEQYIAEIADAFFLAPTQVHVEVAQPHLSSWSPAIAAALQFLRESGIGAAVSELEAASDVDDIARYDFDELRLSRRASHRAVEDRSERDDLARIVVRAHELGITVTASGVDDEPLRDALRDVGCDLATGNVYDRARPATTVD